MKHTTQDLYQMQSLSLEGKIQMTRQRIKGWVNEYGEDGVYISFSGGKDSTVLLDIVRKDYPDIEAVFVDVPTQYPELRTFAESFDNVTVLKPKISFMEVCEKYGFPFISKEVSERVYYAQKYLTWWRSQRKPLTDRQTDRPTDYSLKKFFNLEKTESIPDDYMEILDQFDGKGSFKIKQLLGKTVDSTGRKSRFGYSHYAYLAAAPFYLSNDCCEVMKKRPLHKYQKETGKKPMTAQMASESMIRTQKWLQNGCNGFDLKSPISNPMAFWTEQDVLLYIWINKLPICSVYGEVVPVTEPSGQMNLQDLGIFDLGLPTLKTTGCERTGCMLCGFGCHMEKPGEGRFERLKVTHPGMYKMLDIVKNNGYTMRQAIDWINEHGNTDIRY